MASLVRAYVLILIFLVGASAAKAGIANEIEARTIDLQAEELREGTATDSDSSGRDQRMDQLEAAIRRGEEASGRLREEIQNLEDEKESLERLQVVLTSGLIGALVTAAVALLGAFTNARRSRPERDLRRLEVIAKAYELNRQGVPLPEEFRRLLPDQG